jgi:hypothetical protein
MKTLTTLLIFLLIGTLSHAQEKIELPFFDNFEEPISNDAKFTKWTTENLEGWHYWHIIPGQHMRFEKTDLNQNDWLITKPINCAGADNLKVNFSHLYHANKVPPKLFYTSQYNGHASQSTWKELSYSFGANENQWYQSDDFIIENPGDVIYFAFHYQAAANAGTYFLLDNFSVKSYIPPIPFVLVGNSEHFEFYTNLPESTNYSNDIKDALEKQYAKLSDLWNRPGIENIYSESDKIKVYYSKREDIDKVTPETPIWKISFHNEEKLELYISPILNSIQESYYSNLQSLAINEFSQLAITKRCSRENYINLPAYFLEGFGLYESGFRPRRDSIVKYLNENPEPNFNFVRDTSGINNTLKRDLIISNIEGQILTPWSYSSVNEGASSYIAGQWQNYLKYFYSKSENERIKFQKATSHFDFYGAESDSNHLTEVTQYFENAYSFYIEQYDFKPAHRFNVVICPTEPIGMALTGYSRFNGGAGCGGDLVMQLSPNSGTEADYEKFYAGMSAHEFFHIYYHHFLWQIPGGFWAEGSADFSARHSLGEDIRRDRFWMLEWTFSEYAKKYNVTIDLDHIIKNSNQELDIYYLGDMFFEYLFLNHGGFVKIKEFFNQGMDYSVFNTTYAEIDKGYIHYLKSLLNYIPPDTLLTIPFEDTFEDFSNGWSKPSFNNPDNWQICDDGFNGGNCTRIYINSTKNIPIKSWLITPPFNAKNLEKVVLSFDYSRYGNGSELEIFYTNKFNGEIDKSNWNSIQKISMTESWVWRNSGEITLLTPPDTLFLGIRYSSPGEQHQQVYIDNFKIKQANQNTEPVVISNEVNDITSNSALVNGKVSADGGAKITQRGFYWSSTNTSPNSGDQVIIVSGTTNNFNTTLKNLSPETTYYYRTFATNNIGTALGEIKQFTTLKAIELPVISTKDATNVDHEIAVINGEITSDGGATITECGFYWSSTNSNPERNNSFVEITENITNFSLELKNLTPGKIYYYRSFATNKAGTVLGEVKQFTTINTVSEINSVSQNEFKIYPNPITGNSVISFQIKTFENVDISVYNLQGRKIYTLLNKYLNPGLHTIPVGNKIKVNGIYLCKLATSEEIYTIKLMVTQ